MRLMTCLAIVAATSATGLRRGVAAAQEKGQAATVARRLLPSHGRDLSEYVPQGWRWEARARGQLGNPLRWADALVLVRSSQSTSGSEERALVVALENTSGGYDLAVENHTFLPALKPTERQYFSIGLGVGRNMPPLAFKRGSLVVNIDQTFEVGPNADRVLTYSFRYREGRLVVAGLDEWTVTQRHESVNNSYNFLSGKAVVFGGNCASVAEVAAGCRYKPTWKRIAGNGLPTLEELGSSFEFEPKVQYPIDCGRVLQEVRWI